MNPSFPIHWMRSLLLTAWLGAACAVAQVSPPIPAKAPPAGFKSLVAIKAPYQAEVDRLQRERSEGLAKTLAAYTAELDRMLKESTALADLDAALAVKAERDRLAKNADTFAESNDPAPARILALRAKYAQVRQPLLAGVQKQMAALNQQYVANLDQLQRQFMLYSFSKEAAEVKAERDRVTGATSGGGAAAAGSVVAAKASTLKLGPALPLAAAQQFLTLRDDQWHIDGDAIVGHVDKTRSHLSAPGKSPELAPSMELHYSLKMKAKAYQSIIVWVDDVRCQYSHGHFGNKESMAMLYDGKEQHLPGKVEDPDAWATLAAVVKDGKIQFYYNGKLELEAPLKPPRYESYAFNVGFTSFDADVRVKDVACDLGLARP